MPSGDVRLLGTGKVVRLDVSQVLALENLLGRVIMNHNGAMYDRFLYSHLLFCSTSYATGKRHDNSCISFQHSVYQYGVIIGLMEIKPFCQCSIITLQYCTCEQYGIVIVKPKLMRNRTLCKEVDFDATTYFVTEVEDEDDLIALLPSQIRRKCISLNDTSATYFCPMPFRIYGD